MKIHPQKDLLIYIDSSVYFYEGNSEFQEFAELMDNGDMLPMELGGNATHSIQFATHPGMYSFLMPDPMILPLTMWEANIIMMRKTEVSRQILKW